MTRVETIVLPGMNGTRLLLRDFCKAAPDSHVASSVALPSRTVAGGYPGIARHVAKSLPQDGQVLLVAESFSGPVAVNIAAHHFERVLGVVLVATFVDPPTPWPARFLPWRFMFRLPLPTFVARWAFVGKDASIGSIRELRESVRDVPPAVLADRIKHVMYVDETAALKQCRCPLLYIRPTADRLVPERCWHTIRRLRPDAKLAEIDGPHLILQRKPKEAWRHIAEFTREISRPNR